MNQRQHEAPSRITNPERINRIIARLCDGHMQVIIRTRDNSKTGIRASFRGSDQKNISNTFRFDKISSFGLEKLVHGMQIKVEVIGMPSQVMFVTEVLEKASDSITCSLPSSLVSIERRSNSRFRVTNTAMSFLRFDSWHPSQEDSSSPPFFEAHGDLSSFIPIFDISSSGVCIQSHFPSFMNLLDETSFRTQAHLYLPMTSSIPVQVAVRWKRRIRNRIIEAHEERYQKAFRIGVELIDLQEEQHSRIRDYLRQLSMADAI